MNEDLIDRCEQKLVEVARQRGTITYGELAQHIGVRPRQVGDYLVAVYDRLVRGQQLPDLTLLVVPAGKKYGPFNSQGRAPKSVPVDAQDPEDRRRYDEAREQVYAHWGPAGA